LHEYYERFGARITQDSERLFVDEFLYPLLGEKIGAIEPQYPFLDRTGRARRIDFVCRGSKHALALEVNGETYHAEGIIPNEMFDDNLFRQNEILYAGYHLVRYSYSQLKDPRWRPLIADSVRDAIALAAPELLSAYALEPNEIQREALAALEFHRNAMGWTRGIVVMPTGTGKTILSALDARRVPGKVLFLVHRLDILSQSIDAYRMVWPTMKPGHLTGEVRQDELDCDVLFASKDTLRQPAELMRFGREHFSYVVVDEVHHGQSPTYREIIDYFRPRFMLGMTATPDRLDRKDIFELFDYNKVYEIPVHEVIERGFLVPYTYHGLTDDIDYSRIRFENNRYRVDDLERLLIIPERNEAILKAYLDKGLGDKAIGFCVSISHAERMAAYFKEHGVPAEAVHSQAPNRDKLVADFRENKFNVAFTVDLFNEGVDFPNVRVLLFLRPTESRTVFVQQLGRGLRLSPGKDRVRVLDFIGNYKRANLIRDYLSKEKKVVEVGEGNARKRKIEYTYSTGCEVHFDDKVEEILNQQDAEALGVGKLELTQAYYALAEALSRKPSRAEIDAQGEYKSARYAQVFGSWSQFIREIGEYTEASYHYPQGTHIGHILSILWYFGRPDRAGTPFDNQYIRLRGGHPQGRVGNYTRQVRYKLLAAMELGFVQDDRSIPGNDDVFPELLPLGHEVRTALLPALEQLDLTWPDEDGIPSSRMKEDEAAYNAAVRSRIAADPAAGKVVRGAILAMPAVRQMLAFLYHVARKVTVERSFIYENFFQAPFVQRFMEQEGIEEATLEASKRRCPFLLNLLDALGIIESGRNAVTVRQLVVTPDLVRPYAGEDEALSRKRAQAMIAAWPDHAETLSAEDASILRELFGAQLFTPAYPLAQLLLVEES
jgi:superfamily II DNA or RNA helicase